MTTSRADLPLVVHRADPSSLSAQLVAQLRAAVTSGVVLAGERLPSSRDLAATMGVSRTVVTTAYTQLFAEGWLESRHGAGTYVADVTPAPTPAVAPAPTVTPALAASPAPTAAPAPGLSSTARPGEGARREPIELRPGIPWAAGIEPDVWRRAWRHAGSRPPSCWPDAFGLPELRAELAQYLRRSRALNVTPDQVFMTRGVSNGLTAIAAALVRQGDRVGVEEPGYQAAREVLRRAGAEVVPCRVDEHGIVPEELPAGLRLLYTTPAHQYPLGGRLPVTRRQALTTWARTTGALIVEDDYDGEFRYDVAPLPALYSMDPEVVVYLGTTSKTLSPVFGAGWLVASPDLIRLVARRRREISERVPEPVQYALLALLTSGDLERHVRRMRLEYARRRVVLVEALAPYARVLGDTAGMHVVLELPPACPAEDLVAAAAERGVLVSTVDRYYVGRPALNAIVLGYGATPLPQLRQAATTLQPLLSRHWSCTIPSE